MIGFLRITNFAESWMFIHRKCVRQYEFFCSNRRIGIGMVRFLRFGSPRIRLSCLRHYDSSLHSEKNDPISAKAVHCDVVKRGSCLELFATNILLNAYVKVGFATDALNPFLGVLSGCSSAGLVDQGEDCFEWMIRYHGIEPCLEHYTCMVRLLGRSGQLEKAMNQMDEFPYETSVMIWRAMLSASIDQNNVDFARRSTEEILKINPKDESTYVLLSNMYASVKQWGNIAPVRRRMKEKGVKKEPGLSWIEHQGDVLFRRGNVIKSSGYEAHKWIAGDMKAKRASYVPDREFTARGWLSRLGLSECHLQETAY